MPAIFCWLKNIESAAGEAYNFGSGEPISMIDLVNTIVRLMGRDGDLSPDILLTSKIQKEIDAQYLDSAKVKNQFDWSPTVTLDHGLKQTIDWYGSSWI